MDFAQRILYDMQEEAFHKSLEASFNKSVEEMRKFPIILIQAD